MNDSSPLLQLRSEDRHPNLQEISYYPRATRPVTEGYRKGEDLTLKALGVTFLVLILSCGLFLAQRLPVTTPPTFPEKKPGSKTEPVDINSASREQLVAMSGIGEAYADAIIAGRPYKKKEELKTRKIIPEGNYKMIADKVTARSKK